MSGSRIPDQKGFSIIEVLIGVAIMAVVAVEMASLFQMMNSNTSSLQGKVGSLSLTSSLIQMMSNPTNCTGHLLNGFKTYDSVAALSSSGMPMGFTGDDGVSLIFGPAPGGTPVPLPNYNVSVNSLTFRQTNPASTGVDTNPPYGTLYQGALVASLLKSSNANAQVTGGRGLKDITIGTINIAVDNSNNIVDCFAQPIQAVDACNSLGGSYNSLANPPCQLPYPCDQGLVFMGYDASQNPICSSAATVSVLTCQAGHTVVSNGTSYVCN